MRLHLLFFFLAIAACSQPGESPETVQDESPARSAEWPHGAMVSAANPAAVAAAITVLNEGGHAVDAAIAAHAVLGLVEPESSGIGGSAFMIVYDRASNKTTVYDGREEAPAAATPGMFTVDGQPLGGRDKWALGVSVGVPGTVALYHAAHSSHGLLDWSTLFQPAIRLASDGFEVTNKFIVYNEALKPMMASGEFPNAAAYLFPGDGDGHEPGSRLKNPAYADTLERISSEGARVFYEGDLAEAIVARMRAEPVGSSMTLEDLGNYRVIERDAVCGAFRDNTICSIPPPSSGITHIMIPALYDELLSGDEKTIEDKVAVFVDAQRLAYADRDQFVADPDFVDVPVEYLIDPDYIAHRATQRFAPSALPVPGDPYFAMPEAARIWADDTTVEAAGTSHLSIIDSQGNAVAMTASVGYPWGSVRMTNGFFLNNQMTDFSGASADGLPVANAIAPTKRPRSSMSPTIVFDESGDPLMLTGSAGGSSILAYSTKTILAVLDWDLTASEATDFPNIVARGETVGVEVSAEGGQAIADDLAARGYNVQPGRGENSGLHVIVVTADGLTGSADRRRHGTVGVIPAPGTPR